MTDADQPDEVDLLGELRALVDSTGPRGQWAVAMIDRVLSGATKIEDEFPSRRLGWSDQNLRRNAVRDDLLRRIADHLPADMPPPARAKAVHDRIRAYRNNKWPSDQRRGGPPANADDERALLFAAFRATAGRVPTTKKMIRKIVAPEIG